MKLWPRVWCLVFLTHGVEYCAVGIEYAVIGLVSFGLGLGIGLDLVWFE